MIDIKQAIQRAKEYAVQMLEVDPKELLLEEVRASNKRWIITLSFRARGMLHFDHPLGDSQYSIRSKYDQRELKSFNVNRATGEVEGMINVQPI
ncbi:MAG: hypothetical protein ABSB33_01470 [Tepidisphaeraceae bacterium]|jgi:hypothetical protein